MDHEIRQEGEALVVALRGGVNLGNSADVRLVLLDCVDQRKDLIVDLAEVNHIDSSGIATLIEAYQKSRKHGTRFGVAAMGPAVQRVLHLLQMEKLFEIYASVEEALERSG